MIGYVSSADDCGNYCKIKITVLHTDDFALAQYGCESEVYLADRFSGSVQRIQSPTGMGLVSLAFLKKIINVLRVCEFSQRVAVNVKWRSVGESGAEFAGFEPLDGVWLPLPITNDTASGLCINLTRLFFKKTPKPLETSFVCNMLNTLVMYTGIKMANPFYDVHTGIFCSGELLGVLRRLFKKDFLSYGTMKATSHELENLPAFKNIKRPQLKIKNVINSLGESSVGNTHYDGTDHYFLVGIKRDCMSSLINDMKNCLEKGYGLDRVMICFSKHFDKALERIRTLCEMLVIKGHINRLGDVSYLEFYQLLEAFSFQDKALELKQKVRESANRLRTVRGVEIPDYIYRKD